ncbi:MAGE family-domain-containing protein [Phakopsora pachyrhizi]|uniref:MAGE family-domain-containing protein n=1 Tax=Phakopsora pachyrhizi TaxID=170000 RepID=A0AAV0BGD6_PHAPC|nr:MAGE family-domain-containing protein [Phakopsora pachyrhizi]CAH7686358.1 MAGE family-domain-containing protein [Phakopsora pachyrhizi]
MSLADKETETSARDLARYAIINELRRRPLKREDASKAGLLEGQSRQFGKVLIECNKQLNSIFGMELVEMRPRGLNEQKIALEKELQAQAERESQSQGGRNPGSQLKKPKGSGSTRQYILRSKLPLEIIDKIGKIVDAELAPDDVSGSFWNQEDGSIFDWRRGDELGQLGILGLILALILVNERSLESRQLRVYLKRLGINERWKPPHTPASAHPPVDLDALLGLYCRQGYLECIETGNASGSASQAKLRRQSQAVSQENQNLIWLWGARAEIEFGEKQIAEYISEVYRVAGGTNEAQDADQTNATSASNGSNVKISHNKLMKDITKAAGSELQDSGALRAVTNGIQPVREDEET